MKKNKKLLIISVIGFTLLFVLFIFLIKGTYSMEEQTVDNWYNKSSSGETVVTIIGSSTCSHCQEYKPVITTLAKKYQFKLFFFEADKLNEDDSDKLYNTYDLESFDGRVPYTFIIKDNKFVISKTGFANREDTIEFLKENGVIKN